MHHVLVGVLQEEVTVAPGLFLDRVKNRHPEALGFLKQLVEALVDPKLGLRRRFHAV